MNIPLTRNSIMDLETGQVTKAKERTWIKFFDPKNALNTAIIEPAFLTTEQLEIQVAWQLIEGRVTRKVITGYPLICAWCKTIIDLIPVPNSHGICSTCMAEQAKQLEERE